MLWYINNKRELVDSDYVKSAQGVERTQVDWWPAFGQLDSLTLWTVALVLSVVAWASSAHFYGFQMMRVGLHVRVGCSYLIYRKSLRIAPTRANKPSSASEGPKARSAQTAQQASTMGKMVS